MKKFIIGALALVTVITGGIMSSKIAGATDQGKPVININPVEAEKEVYKDTSFTLEYNLVPESLNTQTDTGNHNVVSIKNVSLEVKDDIDFDVIKVLVDGKEVVKNNNEFILPTFEYGLEGSTNNTTLIAVNKKVEIKFKAKNPRAVKYEKFNERITFKYNNLESKTVIKKATSETIVNVSELVYEGGSIRGESRDPMTVGLGREFTIEHYITPGEISKVVNDVSTPITFSDEQKRNLVYVIDKASIDLQGGNEEVARESIIKGLEEIKDSGATASLIVYDEKAQIVKIDDKDVFSINELISLVEKIESTNKSGNLGDAMRKAEILVEKTKGDDSIVVISAGNPNYYTQVSEGNSAMLSTGVEKDGFNVEDKELSGEYVNKVINEIAANENEGTRWYGINYGLEKEEVVLNDVMKKLEGSVPEVKNPYYDDFAKINRNAVNPISIKATLSVVSKNDSIEIHEKDRSREIELEYNEKLNPVEQFITTRVKIVDLKGAEPMGFDVSSMQNIEVKLTVKYNDKTTEVIFNNLKDFEPGEIPVTWWMKAEVPYIVSTGLYNGRKKLVDRPKEKDIISDIEDVQWACAQLLDELSFAELAVENHFGLGMVIKSPTENVITPILDTKDIIGLSNQDFKLGKVKLYEVESKELKEIVTTDQKYKLEAGKIYLLTIDQYIPEYADSIKTQSLIGQRFKVGINISGLTTSPQEEINPVVGEEVGTEPTTEFWGIEVQCVDKPEHF
ncbi:MAG: hypothetical protein ACRCTZ_22960 [Sarcina sp.]